LPIVMGKATTYLALAMVILLIILLRNHLRAFLNLFGNRLVKGFQMCYTDYSVFVRERNGYLRTPF
ncbi:MAG: hypothetical protein ACFN08_04005, partial [Granulicatella sp.]